MIVFSYIESYVFFTCVLLSSHTVESRCGGVVGVGAGYTWEQY